MTIREIDSPSPGIPFAVKGWVASRITMLNRKFPNPLVHPFKIQFPVQMRGQPKAPKYVYPGQKFQIGIKLKNFGSKSSSVS